MLGKTISARPISDALLPNSVNVSQTTAELLRCEDYPVRRLLTLNFDLDLSKVNVISISLFFCDVDAECNALCQISRKLDLYKTFREIAKSFTNQPTNTRYHNTSWLCLEGNNSEYSRACNIFTELSPPGATYTETH